MKNVTLYFFVLLLITISLYYTTETPVETYLYTNRTFIEGRNQEYFSYPYLKEEQPEDVPESMFHSIRQLFNYWNLSWYEIEYLNSINKQAADEYRLAKNQNERNLILQKHPEYFAKVGRPLINKSECSCDPLP